MSFSANKSLRMLCALLALFVITGDLIADAVHDASGACVTESQSGGCDSCPACIGCAIHSATALADFVALDVVPDDGTGALVPEESDHWAVGLAAAIDHPPQLA
jgi:hypothetical protein